MTEIWSELEENILYPKQKVKNMSFFIEFSHLPTGVKKINLVLKLVSFSQLTLLWLQSQPYNI